MKKALPVLLLASALALSGCQTMGAIAQRYVARNHPLIGEILKDIVGVLVEDVTEDAAAGLAQQMGASMTAPQAVASTRGTIALSGEQQLFIMNVPGRGIGLYLCDPRIEPLCPFAEFSTVKIVKAEIVVEQVFVAGQVFNFYCRILRAKYKD